MQAIPRRASTQLAYALLVVVSLHFLISGLLRPMLHPYAYSDFVTFYGAAQAFAKDQSPYARDVLVQESAPSFSGWVGRYLYPPPFAALVVRPVALLPFATARRLWVAIEAVAYVAAGVLLTHWAWARLTPWTLAATGALLLPFAPFHFDLKLGSVSGLLLLLSAAFLRAHAAHHTTRAALALAAGIVLKLSPALVLFVLLARGEWRLLLRTVLACVGLCVLALPWSGWRVYAEYTRNVLPLLATGNFSWFTNQSLDAFFWRLFVPNPDTTPWLEMPSLYRALTLLTSSLVLLGLWTLARREVRAPRAAAAPWAPAVALLACVLLARVSWESMVVLALPCFVLALRETMAARLGSARSLAFAAAFGLCALPIPYSEQPWSAGLPLLLQSPRLYGMLLAFVACCVQQRAGVPAEGVGREDFAAPSA